MPTRDFLLPDLGEGLEDAEVVAWKVAEGDRVELNDTLVEVNTAKALVEIPAPWEGVVRKLHAAEGEVVKVGQPLVSIDVEVPEEAGESKPKRTAVLVGYGVDEEQESKRARRSRRAATPEPGGPARATPPVRKLAKELGVDLASITGSGPDGRVTRDDVERAAEGEPGSEVAVTWTHPDDGAGVEAHDTARGDFGTISVKGTRRLIAEKMARAAREIPQVTTFLTVDCTWVEELRRELSAESGDRVTALPVIVRALIETLDDHPKLNASFDPDAFEIKLYRSRHVGIATDTERGLLVPVVRDAQRLGVAGLAQEMARLAEAARRGKAKPADLLGSTITVSNVGSFGAEYGTPIINHPESAILAVGVVEPRALVVDGEVEVRPACTLSLTFDHRVMDGAEAGRALKALKDLLESPFRLGALPR